MKVASIVLLVLFALVATGGTRTPLGPVGDRSVVYWTPGEQPCPEGAEYMTQIDKGNGWEDLRIKTRGRPDPYYQMGQCVAFAEGRTALFRACCSNGGRCEIAAAYGTAPDCTAIYEMGSGRRFQQVWVDQWNASHDYVKIWQFIPCGCGESLEVQTMSDAGLWIPSAQNPIPESGKFIQYGDHDDPSNAEVWRIRCIKDGEPQRWYSYAEIRHDACVE